ncbi:DHHC palmitoyltransferase-domain-containing protein [Lipomyces japonicus]|uniref:DHHC palmitoyltransferase-domain-containing protein n=1 Tax=Lipomyces japonicus TaxID=56871 RepID=UPI0034CFB008
MRYLALYYVVAFIVIFSTLVFIILFGRLPAFKGTLVGSAHIFLWHNIPSRLVAIDRQLTGGRIYSYTNRWTSHLVNDKNWTVSIFYLAIITGSLFFFFKEAWQFVRSPIHRLFIPPLAFQPYVYFYFSAFTDPGYITNENVSKMTEEFEHDDIIFYSDQPPCRTCHFSKLARSKHCSVCKHCIARMDHHCAWINNCVGYYNYRYFLGFLLSNLIVLIYGSYLTFDVLFQEYLKQYYAEELRPKYYWASYSKWIRLIHSRSWTPYVSSLFMISTLVAPLIIAFLIQHIIYIHQGMTTNESEKWAEVQFDVELGMLYVYETKETAPKDIGSSSGSDEEASLSTYLGHVENLKPRIDSRRIYVHVYENGEINRLIPVGFSQVERVSSLEAIDNIYDKGGFFNNIKDIIWPKHF